jgi:hypothetical protein
MSQLTLTQAMKLWREHGGRSFGPRVEHVTMEQSKFLGFCNALSALTQPPSPVAAEGYVLVPVEPTPEMVGAWYRYKNGHHFPDEPAPEDTSDYGAYRAMLSARPPIGETVPGAGEPVAWRYRFDLNDDDEWAVTTIEPPAGNVEAGYAQPLYTAPPLASTP